MRLPPPAAPDPRSEAGSVALFLVVVVLGMLAMVALVVDGGGRVAASIRADNAAASAARAGGQAIDTTSILAGRPVAADPLAAAAAARMHLRAAGVSGDARVVPGGRAIEVDAVVDYQPVFLGLVGAGHLSVRGSARAELFVMSGGIP